MSIRTIGITLGDANGVGPEVALRAAQRRWPAGTRIVLVGSEDVVSRTSHRLGLRTPATWSPGTAPKHKISCWDPVPQRTIKPTPGQVRTDAARAAHAWIVAAAQACLDRHLDAMVTAPICKEGMLKAGFDTAGHTELLAQLTETRNYAMMLFGGGLRVVLLTRHIPLRAVPDAVTARSLRDTVQLTLEGLGWLGVRRKKVAVCGLNPHAGEGGKLGTEDHRILAPAVRRLQRAGHDVTGPAPGDTVFHAAIQGNYDAVIAMYHDQGLAPLKTIAFDCGVNLTLGLPIVRTSPDHGTAFGIAGQGIASDGSMAAALRAAIQLADARNPWRVRPARS